MGRGLRTLFRAMMTYAWAQKEAKWTAVKAVSAPSQGLRNVASCLLGRHFEMLLPVTILSKIDKVPDTGDEHSES
jgi:hypothetical protein